MVASVRVWEVKALEVLEVIRMATVVTPEWQGNKA